jgi:hypothetical protein
LYSMGRGFLVQNTPSPAPAKKELLAIIISPFPYSSSRPDLNARVCVSVRVCVRAHTHMRCACCVTRVSMLAPALASNSYFYHCICTYIQRIKIQIHCVSTLAPALAKMLVVCMLCARRHRAWALSSKRDLLSLQKETYFK